MTEYREPERISERILCPNCPADYPIPFSSRHITCRRCGTEFVAPEDARTTWTEKEIDGEWNDVADGTEARDQSVSLASVIVTQLPTIALSLNAVAVLLWVSGIVSFEIAVLTILLITSAIVTEQH
ncbi:hypothetical protein [Natrinema halophilum]|uniref:Uncharacterized protein n=1 Tax=Natrinema halophilum TaxID=1699371 RepID=A0A7D5GGB5_9EURY|nr:hypothetical protein [Natrinema halophilum]QLG48174.1 hypothetical protein HYG82_04590 [Natrinema halophilum]